MSLGGSNVNNGQNGFQDLLDAFRKYLLPEGLGGGYTQEEKTNNKTNLETADKAKPSLNDIGLGGMNDTMQWVLIAVIGFGILTLFKK